jgi:hypothetical protein
MIYRICRPFLIAVALLATLTLISVACGGGSGSNPSGGGGPQASLLRQVLHSAPVRGFFDGRRKFASTHAQGFSLIPTANAQSAPTMGHGNFMGACGTLPNPTISVAATVLNNLGRLTDGRCGDRATPDSDSGAIVGEDGTLGNFEIYVSGTRTNDQSGRVEIYLDGQLVKTYTLGLLPAGVLKDSSSTLPVRAGQRLKVRYWQQAGDQETDLQVLVGWAPLS